MSNTGGPERGRARGAAARGARPAGSGARHGFSRPLLLGALLCVTVLAVSIAPGIVDPSARSQESRYSPDEQLVIDSLGLPAVFTSSWVPDFLVDAELPPVVHNQWHFPDLGVSYTFVNGSFAGSDDTEPLPEMAVVPAISPGAAWEGMSVQDLQALFPMPAVTSFAVPAEIVPNTEFFVFPGVIATVINDRLAYLETNPFVAPETAIPGIRAAGERPRPPAQRVAAERALRAALTRRTASAAAAPRAQPPPAGPLAGSGRGIIDNIADAYKKADRLRQQAEGMTTGLSLVDVQQQFNGTAEYLEEELPRLRDELERVRGVDPVREEQLRAAIEKTEGAARRIRQDLVAELRVEQALQGYAWLPRPQPVGRAMEMTGVDQRGPDPNRIRRLAQEFVHDAGGRQGDISGSMQDWLTMRTGDWQNVSAGARESILANILKDMERQCQRAGQGDSGTCAEVARTTLSRTVMERSGYALDDCLDFIRTQPRAPRHIAPARDGRGAIASALWRGLGFAQPAAAQAPACPTRTNRAEAVAAAATPTPSATSTPAPPPTAAPTPPPTAAPTAAPTPQPTPSPVPTPGPAATPAPTPTPTARPSATPSGPVMLPVGGFTLTQRDGTGTCGFSRAPRTGGTISITVDPAAGTFSGTMTTVSNESSGTRSVRCDDITADLHYNVTYSVTFSGSFDRATGRISGGGRLMGSENGSYSNCRRSSQTITCPPPTTYTNSFTHQVTINGTLNPAARTGSGQFTVTDAPLPTSGDWHIPR